MKISILMPTYECPSDLFIRSITSVFEQTHEDTEVIIKDGSINRRALDDPNVRAFFDKYDGPVEYTYLCSPDGPAPENSGAFGHNGFYEALNQCVKMARGEILCLLCSDDERGPDDTLAYVNSEFEQRRNKPFFLYGGCEWIDRNNKHIETKIPPVVTFERLLRDYTLFTPSLFWNKEVHQKFGFFNEKLAWCADVDFWLRCWRGVETKQVSRVLGKYRVWETSQARANEPSLWEQSSAIQRRHREGQ